MVAFNKNECVLGVEEPSLESAEPSIGRLEDRDRVALPLKSLALSERCTRPGKRPFDVRAEEAVVAAKLEPVGRREGCM